MQMRRVLYGRVVWVVASVACAIACKGKEISGSPPTATSIAASAVSLASAAPAASAAPNADCPSELDYLLPPQKYEDGDLFRAIVADGDQVYFRNYKDVFRVPLAGGRAEVISKGPQLTLTGTAALFASGERLLTQSAGESIFMASPKAGGEWSTIIDLTAKKLGGGRGAVSRILQGPAPHASQATFDGASFYWAEVSRGKGAQAASTATLRSVALSGADAKTLYQTPGDLGSVVKAADRIVFTHNLAPSPADLKSGKAKGGISGRGEQTLMSVPLAGGDAKPLMRITQYLASVVLGTDGSSVYVSGYADEDLRKPGIYRIDANGSNLEQLDKRVLHGRSFVVGDNVIFAGMSQLDPVPTAKLGQVVLSLPRSGKKLTRLSCIADGYTAHAYAVAGKTLLISLFKSDTQMASIVKIALP
jgi:hypothetical protein